MTYPKRILVVDDDPIFRLIAKKLLDKTGENLDITFKENGFEAITFLKQVIKENKTAPDLILLDIGLPILNGWEFMEEFIKIPQEATQHIQIYIVSSSAEPEDRSRSKSYPHVKAYVPKPLSIDIVKDILQSL
ncbi:response regulator [Parafilimonas sp.]|uniref:response regulator n=1 Tax=Parafilimonas sp. TaxID=1969739 RepID=UPI0039E4091A